MAVVAVSLSSGAVTVNAGGEATATLSVRNGSESVHRVGLEVCGDAAAWTVLEPSSMSLLPGQQRDVTVRFRPPREPVPNAGNVPFAVKATPRERPAESVVEEGDVVVNAFVATTATIDPPTSTGFRRGRHVVRVRNGGNTPATVQLSASDPEGALLVDVRPTTLGLDPGFVGRARVLVRRQRRGRRGEPRHRPFRVDVRTEGGGTLVLGAGIQSRSLPVGLLAVVLAGLAALVAGGVLYAKHTADVRDALPAVRSKAPVTTAPKGPATSGAPRGTTPAPSAPAPPTGEAAALAMGATCRTTTDLKTNGKVLSSPDGAFVRQFADESTAVAARDLLTRHPTVCTIGNAARGDSLLTFYPPPLDATPTVPGSRCSARYAPAALTKNQAAGIYAVDVGPDEHLLYASEADRDRAFALLQGHTQICWVGGGREDIFSNFFEWSSAVTYL